MGVAVDLVGREGMATYQLLTRDAASVVLEVVRMWVMAGYMAVVAAGTVADTGAAFSGHILEGIAVGI